VTTPYLDLFKLAEDDRITAIGELAMKGTVVGVMVDDDGKKADRYLRKLAKRFPDVVEISREKGPVAGVLTLKIGKRTH
jgi:hypothetical protein